MSQLIKSKFIWCLLIIFSSILYPSAAPAAPLAEHEQALNEISKHLGRPYEAHHTISKGRFVYILVTTSESGQPYLNVWHARLDKQGKWTNISGVGIAVADKPWRLFRSRKNLQYSLTRSASYNAREDLMVQFDWCLFGYTTDASVKRFRIKTKTGFIPLTTIDKRYFMRLLSDNERNEFVEVQGLDSNGKVVQRSNGVDEFKPRQWSPQHSEM